MSFAKPLPPRASEIFACISAILLCICMPVRGADEVTCLAGVAKVDITPDYPIRLSGYGNRRLESEGIGQHIWAKALAFGSDADGPALLVTVDNCGVPAAMRDEVIARLAKKTKVASDRFALCFSHTHCAPCLSGALPNIFSSDIPPEQQERIDRYSRELTAKLEQVALAALADRRPANLAWAQGCVSFARNRRAQGGPVDFSLPALFITAPDGKLRGVFTSYACHATTLQENRISGDWPGYAMEAIERDHPGAVALVALGCGADQNPHPRSTVDLARRHGESVGAEVTRLLASAVKPIHGAPDCRTKPIDLPFDPLPTRDEWVQLAKSPSGNIAYHARRNLARLDRGETLPTQVPYLVQTWTFGSDLAMVFLPGEVVVDYALRLKIECDASRLWVNAYSNDATCYIPSRRVLAEGGYEGGLAMVYYDRPTKFAPGVEDRIIAAVHDVLPKDFVAKKPESLPMPKSPADSWAAIKTKDGLSVSLAVAEPMVESPVAIDWGADGRLWVAEMRDYPLGSDGHYKPGGVIKVLEDTDHDGRYDKATVFLEGLPFPTGVMAWGRGVLICAAPDIIYAEDTDGSGHATVVRKLFTGFATDNYQARVNSLALGLDNWVHGANGLLGGEIRSFAGGTPVDIRGRDFRLRPDTGAFEPVAGVTQQGRCRDDWDEWFGCSNSALLFHFPIPDRYLRRNPHVPAPPSRVNLPADAEPNRLYPIGATLERFNNPAGIHETTSACGLGLYRDNLIAGLEGDAFTCEPVNNLVHRLKLAQKGVTFESRRAADEQTNEFLASTDNWFRPVQVRTGPDGALWIVDMYRGVIEHPRWIPGDKLAQLDVRAGAEKGRIYRVQATNTKPRPVRDLTKLTTPELVSALDTPNGTVRDLVHQELLHRGDATARELLLTLMMDGKSPAVRVQALCVLDGLQATPPVLLHSALRDPLPEMRRHAIQIAEGRIASLPQIEDAFLALADDPDLRVRYQLALSLGEWDDPRADGALVAVARTAMEDPWMRAAVLSSSSRRPLAILKGVLSSAYHTAGRTELIGGLAATAAATAGKAEHLRELIQTVAPAAGAQIEGWNMVALLHAQDALDRRKTSIETLFDSPDAALRSAAKEIRRVYAAAPAIAESEADAPVRLAAIRLMGRGSSDAKTALPKLARFLLPDADAAFQKAALDTLARSTSAEVPGILLADWSRHGPAMRASIVNALLGREAWALALLDAVAKGAVAAADVPSTHRERLRKHSNAAIRERADSLLPGGGATDRAAVVAKYAVTATLIGDAAKGAMVFKNVCSTCHSYLGNGNEVGPNIGTYRTKPVQDFLIAILDPNAVVEPRYAAYTAQLKDGRTLCGVISSETATTLMIAQPGGVRESLLRSDITSLRGSPLSLMPEGLEQAITPQDMADLISYLKGSGY